MRHEPPSIDEAVNAARDLTADIGQQVEIAAALMGLSDEEVREYVSKQKPEPRVAASSESGARVVIVKRRLPASLLQDKQHARTLARRI